MNARVLPKRRKVTRRMRADKTERGREEEEDRAEKTPRKTNLINLVGSAKKVASI
jgi:hypothetical protein